MEIMRKYLFWFVGTFLAAAPSQATDYVSKIIDCPSDIQIQLDFVHHSGSGPTFTEAGGGGMYAMGARLTGISRDGQKISCTYHGNGFYAGRTAKYSYTVHRKILECKPYGYGSNNALQCRLEP